MPVACPTRHQQTGPPAEQNTAGRRRGDLFQTHANGRPDTPSGLGQANQEQDKPPRHPSAAAPERCTFLRADTDVTTRITPDQKHLPPRYRTSEAMIIDRREYPRPMDGGRSPAGSLRTG